MGIARWSRGARTFVRRGGYGPAELPTALSRAVRLYFQLFSC